MAADPKNNNMGHWTIGPACRRCGQSTIMFCRSATTAARRRRTLICDHCRADEERHKPLQVIVQTEPG
jgi:hypothetical protein